MTIVQQGEMKHGKRSRIKRNEKPARIVRWPNEERFGGFFMRMASVAQSQGPEQMRTPLSTETCPLAVLILVALISSCISENVPPQNLC